MWGVTLFLLTQSLHGKDIKEARRLQQCGPPSSGPLTWTVDTQLQANEVQEYQNFVNSNTICVKTLSMDGCSPNAQTGCEPSAVAQSVCTSQPAATVTNNGGIFSTTFSGFHVQSGCAYGGGVCARARSCMAAKMESNAQYLPVGGSIQYNWRAQGGGDWYDMGIGLIKNGVLVSLELYRGNVMNAFGTDQMVISNTLGAGMYSLRIYVGSYDRTCGGLVGASLQLDPSKSGYFCTAPDLVDRFDVINGATQFPTSAPTRATNGGDVHFSTLDGLVYTFNAPGDYVYARSEHKFDLHVRTVWTGVNTASVLAAIALRDYESGMILEVWWDGKGAENINVNTRSKQNKYKNKVIDFSNGDRYEMPFILKLDEDNKRLYITRENWQDFSLEILYGGRANFKLKMDKNWRTQGLGGNHNGFPGDDLCDRKERCIPMTASSEKIHRAAMDWKVRKNELLFEKWMKTTDYELLYHPLKVNVTEYSQAINVCQNHRLCIFDYLSTKSEQFALFTKQDFDMKKLNYVGDDV